MKKFQDAFNDYENEADYLTADATIDAMKVMRQNEVRL